MNPALFLQGRQQSALIEKILLMFGRLLLPDAVDEFPQYVFEVIVGGK